GRSRGFESRFPLHSLIRGLRPRTPYTLTRGAPRSPLRSRGSLATARSLLTGDLVPRPRARRNAHRSCAHRNRSDARDTSLLFHRSTQIGALHLIGVSIALQKIDDLL